MQPDPYVEGRLKQLQPAPKLADMIEAVDAATTLLASGQRAAVAANLRTDCHEPTMRQIVCLEACYELLGRILAHVGDWPPKVQAVIKPPKETR